MPLYDFKCLEGHIFERMVRLADFEEAQHCACGEQAVRVISAPLFSVENVGYDCPVTGKWIGSKRAHEENLKQTDSRVLEPGERTLNMKTKEAEEARFEKSVEDTVEKFYDALPSEKREQLANEVASGMDVAVERKAV